MEENKKLDEGSMKKLPAVTGLMKTAISIIWI